MFYPRWLYGRHSYQALQAIPKVLLLCLLFLTTQAHAQQELGPGAALTPAGIQSNASPADLTAIMSAVSGLERGVAQKDTNTLAFFGLTTDATRYANLRLDARITHIAVSNTGALVRQKFRIAGQSTPGGNVTALNDSSHEFFLARTANGFTWSDKHWMGHADAVSALAEAAREEWERPSPGKSLPPTNSILHLVAERRGGRWIALRRSRWEGALLDARNLLSAARGQNIPLGFAIDPDWLRAQMNALQGGAGTGHFILQRGQNGWVGLGAAWDDNERIPATTDQAARQARATIEGSSYTSANAHKAFGVALAQVGLWSEAAEALDKAEALQPGIAGANLLKQVNSSRSRDPETTAYAQLQNEARVGLDPNHPSYLVSALVQDYTNQPSVLRALRLGLEYSRLGDDTRSAAWLDAAQDLAQNGALRSASRSDAQWIEVLFEHLQERRQLASAKPPNIIRSPLFVLRCFPNDLSVVQVLAALESSQHTVYADFNIPMGCTEVLFWRNQDDFQRYTTRFSEQGQSEFVAALTLTKLIPSSQGPVVLGEEINAFYDPRMAIFHTVAHEYGHVAVRQLSKGRDVPTWFNEGIATSVEGGYDGYLERVRAAANARALLTMDEMLQWNVDGQRAFVAYSQANSIIDYIVATWGKDAVLNILRQIGADTDPDAAFQNVLGISQYELWRRWAQNLKG